MSQSLRTSCPINCVLNDRHPTSSTNMNRKWIFYTLTVIIIYMLSRLHTKNDLCKRRRRVCSDVLVITRFARTGKHFRPHQLQRIQVAMSRHFLSSHLNTDSITLCFQDFVFGMTCGSQPATSDVSRNGLIPIMRGRLVLFPFVY
jgi:hypothetical protein